MSHFLLARYSTSAPRLHIEICVDWEFRAWLLFLIGFPWKCCLEEIDWSIHHHLYTILTAYSSFLMETCYHYCITYKRRSRETDDERNSTRAHNTQIELFVLLLCRSASRHCLSLSPQRLWPCCPATICVRIAGGGSLLCKRLKIGRFIEKAAGCAYIIF